MLPLQSKRRRRFPLPAHSKKAGKPFPKCLISGDLIAPGQKKDRENPLSLFRVCTEAQYEAQKLKRTPNRKTRSSTPSRPYL